MGVIDVEVPTDIEKQLSSLKKVSYNDIIEHYENSFEYEKINMEAGDFYNTLKSELQDG